MVILGTDPSSDLASHLHVDPGLMGSFPAKDTASSGVMNYPSPPPLRVADLALPSRSSSWATSYMQRESVTLLDELLEAALAARCP